MENNGLIVKESSHNFESTYRSIKEKIEQNPNLKIILELDHSANAAAKGLELRPTKLIVFGNPNIGTPLMHASPALALDLPQKILVYQEQEKICIAYNNPNYLKERHQVHDKEVVLTKIAAVLDFITTI